MIAIQIGASVSHLVVICSIQPPMNTVGQPRVITPPWAVMSPARAAGIPPINTVAEPFTMLSGGPVHVAISPTRAAGMPPISTVGQPGGNMGPPTWGFGPSDMGQVCMSPTRAAIDISVITN